MRFAILAFFALAGARSACSAETPTEISVPVVQAPYHLPVFKNDYVTMLNIYVPPGRNTGFHTHTDASVSINVEAADMVNQDLGGEPTAAQRSQWGRASYTDYRKQPRTHKASNVGTTPFHNVVFIFNRAQPNGAEVSSRAAVPGYEQVMDNERARGWRVVLEPGQSVGAVTPLAPGLRVFLTGGEIAESVPRRPERRMNPKLGEFYWQEAGVTRAIRNSGTARMEFLEFELK